MKGRSLLKGLAWIGGAGALVLALLAAPIVYVETVCTADAVPQNEGRLVDAHWKRTEAATFLTYPEWHIVYAYEELAQTLKQGDEHDFGYGSSILGFWKSYCELNRKAGQHGGAGSDTRTMIYVIGTSFTVELALKAFYEETAGRLTATWRGSTKTPEDIVSAEMADRYATFLQQVPWYKYPFAEEITRLQGAGGETLRSLERRIGLGLEWKAKEAYASVIAQAVAASGEAKLEIRAAVRGLDEQALTTIDGVVVVGKVDGATLIQAPRYRRFTEILAEIAARGGEIEEIAGNDDILVTVLHDGNGSPQLANGEVLSDLARQGFGDRRMLLAVKVPQLASFMRGLSRQGSVRLEHVYDY